jgi:polyisoprenoid-binding protein YceI
LRGNREPLSFPGKAAFGAADPGEGVMASYKRFVGNLAVVTVLAALPLTGALAQVSANPELSPGLLASKDTRSSDPSKVKSGDYMSEPNHGRILWMLSHQGYSHFFAILADNKALLKLDAEHPENSQLTVTINMATVNPLVPADHFLPLLKSERIFDTAKYPTATFKSTKIVRTAPNKAIVTGDLTFRGITKPLDLNVTFNQSGEGPAPGYKVGFDATGTLKRSQWGLTELLPSVGDDVSLTIEAEFVPIKKP